MILYCSTDLIFVLLEEPNVLNPTRFAIKLYAAKVLEKMFDRVDEGS